MCYYLLLFITNLYIYLEFKFYYFYVITLMNRQTSRWYIKITQLIYKFNTKRRAGSAIKHGTSLHWTIWVTYLNHNTAYKYVHENCLYIELMIFSCFWAPIYWIKSSNIIKSIKMAAPRRKLWEITDEKIMQQAPI